MAKTKEFKIHHPLAPSAAPRWFVCSSEPALRASLPPGATSFYAVEGTTAHWVGESALRNGKRARDYVGQVCPETKLLITDDMAAPVQIYIDYCNNVRGEWHKIEVKFTLPKISADLGGTCDFASVTNTTLNVVDLKYGTGYAVEPLDNPQLLIYALGAYEELRRTDPKLAAKLTSLKYGIVQPRLEGSGPVKMEAMLIYDLLEWKLKTLFPAVTATEALNTEYVAGPHCRFCPGKAVCPAQQEQAQRLAQIDFSVVPSGMPPKPDSLKADQIGKILEAKDDLNSWLNAVEAHAQSILDSGGEVPGFKLVQKRANRIWADEAKAEVALKAMIGDDAFAPRKLLSVAQVEKAIKFLEKEVPKELIARPDTGNIIAPLSDKRPPVARSAISDFTEPNDFMA